jgi:hypothetical protein
MDRDDELEPRSEASRDELDAVIGLHHPQPQVRALNQTVGVADELGRLAAAFVLLLAILIALAAAVSAWFWLGAGVWTGYAVATFLWLRRRKPPAQKQLPAARE